MWPKAVKDDSIGGRRLRSFEQLLLPETGTFAMLS
jgi:hypothetical protein